MKFAYEKPAKSCEMEDFNCRSLELKSDSSVSCKNKAEWKRPKTTEISASSTDSEAH